MSSETEVGSRHVKAQTLFQYGTDAALKANLDYAIDMFKNACKLAPENLLYRQSLRGVERRKFGNDPSKVSRMIGAKLQGIRMSARSAKSKANWGQVLELCEEAFLQSPWDVTAARDGAEAAEGLGLKELARWLMESVYLQGKGGRRLPPPLRRGLRVERGLGEGDRLLRAHPGGRPLRRDGRRRANDLSAKATISRSGLSNALNKKAEGSSGPEAFAPDLDDLKRKAQTPEERYRKEIEDDPKRIGAYLGLAEHYKMESRLDEAEQILSKGLKGVPRRLDPQDGPRRRPSSPGSAARSTRGPRRRRRIRATPRRRKSTSNSSARSSPTRPRS